MAVAAHDGPRLGEIAPQTGLPHGGRIAIPVNDNQPAAGQGQIQHIGQPQGLGCAGGPVVVSTYREHRMVTPSARQGTCIQHIAGVHQDVAAVQHPAQPFCHRTMGVGNQANAHCAGPCTLQGVARQLTPIDAVDLHGSGL
jgi:hypothetical protein